VKQNIYEDDEFSSDMHQALNYFIDMYLADCIEWFHLATTDTTYVVIVINIIIIIVYHLTYLLHGAKSFLRS
jgi:hypothetical protein